MIDLIKLVMAKPLQGVVASLCVFTMVLYVGLNEVRMAVAINNEKQRMDEKVAEKVYQNYETIIRVDENLKYLLNHIESTNNENYVKPKVQY